MVPTGVMVVCSTLCPGHLTRQGKSEIVVPWAANIPGPVMLMEAGRRGYVVEREVEEMMLGIDSMDVVVLCPQNPSSTGRFERKLV